MKRIRLATIAVLLCLTTNAFALTEAEKITALLDAVEKSNMIFIRNGREYSAKRARKHLELKLSKTRGRIRTARQFIKYLASKSSWTGRPYYVRLPNGKKMKAGVWLMSTLKKIEKRGTKQR